MLPRGVVLVRGGVATPRSHGVFATCTVPHCPPLSPTRYIEAAVSAIGVDDPKAGTSSIWLRISENVDQGCLFAIESMAFGAGLDEVLALLLDPPPAALGLLRPPRLGLAFGHLPLFGFQC